MPPFSVAFVKGWRRCSSLLAVCCALKALTVDPSEIPRALLVAGWQGFVEWLYIKPSRRHACSQVSARTIHCTCGTYGSEKNQVFANRGITMSSAATRRHPHVFNFLRQVEVLSRAGHGQAGQQFEVARPGGLFQLDGWLVDIRFDRDNCLRIGYQSLHGHENSQDWSNSTAVSKAFALGRTEALAVTHLQSNMDSSVVLALKQAVSKRGMRGFLSHELIARGLFNRSFTSGVGACEAWVSQMTNGEESEIAPGSVESLRLAC